MKVIKWLDQHLEEAILVVLVCFISCSMMLQVIMRFLFESPLSWPEELSQYSLVLAGFISVPYCVRKENAIRIDIIVTYLPKPLQKTIDVFMHVVMIGLLVWLFTGGWVVFQGAAAHGNQTATLRLPTSLIYGLCLAFTGLGIFRMIQHIVLVLMKKEVTEDTSFAET